MQTTGLTKFGRRVAIAGVIVFGAAVAVRADDAPTGSSPALMANMAAHSMGNDDGHAVTPAGLFGAALAGEGKLMVAYTPMMMHMENTLIGSTSVTPTTIATSVHSGTTMRMGMMTVPVDYRIVPTSMDVEAHMVHLMYGITDWASVAAMGSYLNKSMAMSTFMGMSGSTVLGPSNASVNGLGDTSVAALVRLYKDPIHQVHVNAGLSLPSGSTTETVTMLSPMNKYMTMRASYGMQLGTGTVDALPGLTYSGHLDEWTWGAAYRSKIALDDNSEGYNYGVQHEIQGWSGYSVIPGVTVTGRTVWSNQGRIHGQDAQIYGLMQGTNPALYGGTRMDLLGGFSVAGTRVGYDRWRLAVEGGAPIFQDLNGPQLARSWQLNFALSAGF